MTLADSTAHPVATIREDALQARYRLVALGPNRTKPSRSYGTGRTCRDCGITLSRYNPDEACSRCEPWHKLTGGPPTRRRVA